MIINNFKNILDKYNSKRKSPIKLRQLARVTGISRSSLRLLYKNKNNGIRYATLDKLVSFFNVPVSKFLYYRKSPTNITIRNFGVGVSKSELAKLKSEDFFNNIPKLSHYLFLQVNNDPFLITFKPVLLPSIKPNLIKFTIIYKIHGKISNDKRIELSNAVNNFNRKQKDYIIKRILLTGSVLTSNQIRTSNKYQLVSTLSSLGNPNERINLGKFTHSLILSRSIEKTKQSPKFKYYHSYGHHIILGNNPVSHIRDCTRVHPK